MPFVSDRASFADLTCARFLSKLVSISEQERAPRMKPAFALFGFLIGATIPAVSSAQEVLPFPTTPSASTAGMTMQGSIYKNRVETKHLRSDAPNILIILMDDVGPGQASDYGGEVDTQAPPRIRNGGIPDNAVP